jgi:hypothetical protein
MTLLLMVGEEGSFGCGNVIPSLRSEALEPPNLSAKDLIRSIPSSNQNSRWIMTQGAQNLA